jgi:hypothetical protein
MTKRPQPEVEVIDEMLADLNLNEREAAHLRAALEQVADLVRTTLAPEPLRVATEVTPDPSPAA